MTPINTDKATAQHTILQRSVCMLLSCTYLGNHRKVELDSLYVEKDGVKIDRKAKKQMGANKKLFSSEQLRPCTSVISALKNELRALSVDGGGRMFGPGAYLLPLMNVERAEQACERAQAFLIEKVEERVQMLPDLLDERREALGAMFDQSEYPTADDLRAAYSIDWSYVGFGAPERLQDVSAAAYTKSKSNWDEKLSSAYDDVIVGLRQSAVMVMKELASKLKPGEDGKVKALQPTALKDLQQLLEQLPVLNSIGQDTDLLDALARIGTVSQGVDVETLRKAPALRGMLLAEAEKAAEALEGLVMTGRRGMAL